jgi:general secretion pathway protein A
MTSLKGDSAVVSLGREIKTVDVNEIARWWSGDYLLLWRAPPEYRDELRPGGRGPMVAWLHGELARIEGKAEPGVADRLYRGEMVKKVRRLQISGGLVPDGVVGPRTIMALTAAAGRGEPLIRDGKGDD